MDIPTVKQPIISANVSKERDLYNMLVFTLGRSPVDSVQVVAFLMWLQTVIITDVANLLIGEAMKLPSEIVECLAGEIMQCLKFVQSEIIMPFTDGVYEISLLQQFVRETSKLDITLDHLHRNRYLVIKGVREMVRVFNGVSDEEEDSITSATGSTSTAASTTASPRSPTTPGSKFCSEDSGDCSGATKGKAVAKSNEVEESSIILALPPKKAEVEAPMVNRCVPYSRSRREEEEERTIFLTFSNGYPIPAQEVALFFNRKFGRNVVDKIYMQNVEVDKQVLYARMVCTDQAAVHAVASYGGAKYIAKYIIRGRHVWARRYEKRYHQANRSASASA